MSSQSVSSGSPENKQDCGPADIPVTFDSAPSNENIPGWPSQLQEQELNWSNTMPPISSFLPASRQSSTSLTDIHSVVPTPAGISHHDVVPGYSYSSYMATEANPGQAQMPSPATSESFSPWMPGGELPPHISSGDIVGGYQIPQSLSDSAIEVLHSRHLFHKYNYHQGSGVQSAPDVSSSISKDCFSSAPGTRNTAVQAHSHLPDVVPGSVSPIIEQPKTLKQAVCMYIDHLIKDNERMVSLSQCHVTASPANFEREAYYHEAVAKVMDFPSSRFRYWLQNYNIDIQVVPADNSDKTNQQEYHQQNEGNKDITNIKARDLTLVTQCQTNPQTNRMEDNHYPIYTSNLTPSKPLTFQTPIDDFTDDDSELDTSVSVTDTPEISLTLTPKGTPVHVVTGIQRRNGSRNHTPRSIRQSLFNTPKQMPKTPEDSFGKHGYSCPSESKPCALADICKSSPPCARIMDAERSLESFADVSSDNNQVEFIDVVPPKKEKSPVHEIASGLIFNDSVDKPTFSEPGDLETDSYSSPQSATCSISPALRSKKRTKSSPNNSRSSTKQQDCQTKISPGRSTTSPTSAGEEITPPRKRWKSASAPSLDTSGPRLLRSHTGGRGQLTVGRGTRTSKSVEIVHETEDPLAAR